MVFDLDGTLIDSAPDIADAVNALVVELGRPALTLESVRPMIGDGMRNLVARALSAGGEPPSPGDVEVFAKRCLAIYEAHPVLRTRPFAGVVETLERLHRSGFALAVCTNKPDRPARAILDALELSGFFGALVGGESAPALKPDPRHLAHTLERLGAVPGSAVMVGDSGNDVNVARGLGVPSVCVTYGYSTVPVESLGADRLIDDFADLIGALEGL
ncbi:MAG: phosphoglycolate phosphatase [Alphaproteobacteria bacterium]